MSFALAITTGPHLGASVLPAEGITKFGRSPGADFLLPADRFLSPFHFSIQRRGEDFQVLDASSRNGTEVNGIRLSEAKLLAEGDRIVAGRSMFQVLRASPTQPVAPGPVPLAKPPAAHAPDLTAIAKRACLVLETEPGNTFAILDAARDPAVLELLESSRAQWQSLYEGERAGQLRVVAPYLVSLAGDPASLEKLIRFGWGRSLAVFISTSVPFEQLRSHLRHLLIATTPAGEKRVFRFYDPRVLPVYLQASSPLDLSEFFGSIVAFLMEDESPELLVSFCRGARGLRREVAELTEKGEA